MRAPAFWWRAEPTPLARALAPLGSVWGRVASRRMRQAGSRATLPIVCVGNFVAGGAGKTPAALALADILLALGERPAFLSRGHGGRLEGPVEVNAGLHTARDVGDEALLLARKAPAVVARDRVAGAALAARQGASVVVMDDGLQNPSLEKDLAVAVVDGAAGVGNRLCIPAGPLRAPLADQLDHVHALVVVGAGAAGAATAKAAGARLPVLAARIVAGAVPSASLRGRRVLAFAGIGRPEKFFATLAQGGAVVVEAMAFPDHHVFSGDDVARILRTSAERGLIAVTTEKDAARLGGRGDAVPLLKAAHVLPVSLHFDQEEEVRALLSAALARRRAQR